MFVELAIGDGVVLRRVVAFPDDRDLVAVGGNLDFAILEPLDRDVAVEKGVLTFVMGFDHSMRLPCSCQKAFGSTRSSRTRR